MNKKLSVFLFLFISFDLISFQEDYESDVGMISGDMFVDRYTANDPTGYCVLDKIPPEYCGRVSLDLQGETFKKYSLNTDVPVEVRDDSVLKVKNSFQLGLDHAEYLVPTAGQLLQLFEDGLLTQKAYCYWIRTGPVKTELAGFNFTGCGNIGRLTRLVTADFPSKCGDSYSLCGLYTTKYGPTIQLRRGNGQLPSSSYPIDPSYKVVYTLPSGKRETHIEKMKKIGTRYRLNLPYGTRDVDLYFVQSGVIKDQVLDLDVENHLCMEAYMDLKFDFGPWGNWFYRFEYTC